MTCCFNSNFPRRIILILKKKKRKIDIIIRDVYIVSLVLSLVFFYLKKEKKRRKTRIDGRERERLRNNSSKVSFLEKGILSWERVSANLEVLLARFPLGILTWGTRRTCRGDCKMVVVVEFPQLGRRFSKFNRLVLDFYSPRKRSEMKTLISSRIELICLD